MRDKKILIFYPNNFYEMSSGTHRRVYNLLGYLKDSGFSTDLLSLSGFTNKWSADDIRRKDLVDSIHVCEWEPSLRERLSQQIAFRSGRLPDQTFSALRKKFKELIAASDYGFVIVSYVYWANLAQLAGNAVKVIDMHDFVTLNNYFHRGKKEFRLGGMFEDEVRAISRFQYALSISEEETLALSPFCPETRFVNVPVSFPVRFSEKEKKDPLYDILFIGSDNVFNQRGIAWFMEGVYPLLPKTASMAVVGRISGYVEKKENIALFPHIDDLDEIYRKSRIVICPLKDGTGLKVKVIEALSYGKPVVTTSWGLTGILHKHDNGCLLADDEKGFAKAITLLLDDDKEYRDVKKKAEEFFNRHFSTDVVYRNLDSVFRGTGPARAKGKAGV